MRTIATAAKASTMAMTAMPASSRARSDTDPTGLYCVSRSTYPTPRMVWINRGSTSSTLRRR